MLKPPLPTLVLLVFGHVDLHILYLWKALRAQLDNSDPPTPQGWSVAVLNSYITFIRDDILPRRLVDNTGYLRNIFVASVIMPCVDVSKILFHPYIQLLLIPVLGRAPRRER